MSHQILNVVKKFSCHDNRMQFLYPGLIVLVFSPVFGAAARVGFLECEIFNTHQQEIGSGVHRDGSL